MTDRTPQERVRSRTVLHDPLIDGAGATPPDAPVPPPPPALTASRHDDVAGTRTRRSKHPALSARVLATGLATTGMFGLTAGYAFSAPAKSSPVPGTDTGAAQVPGTGAASVAPADTTPPALASPSGAATPSNTAAPAVTAAPPVVVLQVPTVAPATPGSSAGSGWSPSPDPGNQQSSGSN